jgi:hypothetical protein
VRAGLLTYSVGNERNPGDPWGRSELVIAADGSARLDHYFSRAGGAGGWTGQVDATVLEALRSALERAGFPAAPMFRPVAGSTVRVLTVEEQGNRRQALVDWHQALSLPGYAEAFDLLDGVIRQLSGGTVGYPTKQSAVVHDIKVVSRDA